MVVAECAPVRQKVTHIALVAWESRSVYRNQNRMTPIPPTTSLESAGNALVPNQGESNASTTASSKVPHGPIRRLYSRLIRSAGICRFLTHQSGSTSHDRVHDCERNRDPALHDGPAGKREVKMEVLVERFCYHPEGTLGVMTVGGEEFYTVERPWEENLPRISCIPEGTYEMKRRKSPKFGWCWEVKDVPNRTYILFHSANFPDELQGCIAPGMSLMSDRIAVSRSRDAMKEFEELTHEQECSLVIKFAPSAALKSQ